MWYKIKKSLIMLGLTAAIIGLFLSIMVLLIEMDHRYKMQRTVQQAHIDVATAQEIYKAEMNVYMKMCMVIGAPKELCLMTWISGGKR